MLDYDAIIDSPVGKLGIRTAGDCITTIAFTTGAAYRGLTPLSKEAVKQLQYYFTKPNFSFDLPLSNQGTLFQQKVWNKLRSMLPGTTITYGGLAAQLHTGPRAIGNACRRNPILILIPCHRVVASNNDGGFAGTTSGHWLAIKKWLLQHEQKFE